jgi:hypothetical protein
MQPILAHSHQLLRNINLATGFALPIPERKRARVSRVLVLNAALIA